MISVFLSFFFFGVCDLCSEKDCLFIQLARLVRKFVLSVKSWRNALWVSVRLFRRKQDMKGEKTYLDILYKQAHLLIGVLQLKVCALKVKKD